MVAEDLVNLAKREDPNDTPDLSMLLSASTSSNKVKNLELIDDFIQTHYNGVPQVEALIPLLKGNYCLRNQILCTNIGFF